MSDAADVLSRAYPYLDEEMQRLETLLFANRYPDAIDCVGLHGLCSALAVGPACPAGFDTAQFALGLDDLSASAEDAADQKGTAAKKPDRDATRLADDLAFLRFSIERLVRHIRRQLDNEMTPVLPEELEVESDSEDQTALENWCLGFTEIVLTHEDVWLAEKDEEVARLIAVVLAIADVDDLPASKEGDGLSLAELLERSSDTDMSISESLVELYVLFNAD